MTKTIAVVEDERDVAELVKHTLERDGFVVRLYRDGSAAAAAIARDPPDAVVLDVMLPGLDGLELCRRLRSDVKTARVPILMLTARSEVADEVAGLEVGADDYVAKPFAPRALLARVRSALRRSAEPDDPKEHVSAGPIRVDLGRHEVRVEGVLIPLTATEFKILHFLCSRPGRVRSRYEIVENVSGEVAVLERTVDAHVTSLRRKLGAAGDFVETVRGVGYRVRGE